MARRNYVVRTERHGRVIARRVRTTGSVTDRKYAWSNDPSRIVRLTYEQAKGVRRRYGGKIVCL